jgi:hypothetical protein
VREMISGSCEGVGGDGARAVECAEVRILRVAREESN